MTSRNWLNGWDPQLLPRLDQLDVATPTPTLPDEDLAADAPAPVMTPAGLPRRIPFATSAVLDDLDAPVPYALPDAPSLVVMDAQEALNEAAFAWADADPDHDPHGSTEADLIAAIVRFRAVTR